MRCQTPASRARKFPATKIQLQPLRQELDNQITTQLDCCFPIVLWSITLLRHRIQGSQLFFCINCQLRAQVAQPIALFSSSNCKPTHHHTPPSCPIPLGAFPVEKKEGKVKQIKHHACNISAPKGQEVATLQLHEKVPEASSTTALPSDYPACRRGPTKLLYSFFGPSSSRAY